MTVGNLSNENRPRMPGNIHCLSLSPDCVSEHNLQTAHSALILDKLAGANHDSLNVPPLVTPLKFGRKSETVEGIKKSIDMLGIPPVPPTIPKPINRLRRRSVSESEGQRRAIFGQYWSTKRQGFSVTPTTSTKGSLASPTIAKGSNSEGRTKSKVNAPPDPVRKRSSSLSIVESVTPPEVPQNYRMYAPPKEHADRSSICGRFESVVDVPPGHLIASLPPLPTPLRRLCLGGESPGYLHGMYPLVTPVSVLKQSSYLSQSGRRMDINQGTRSDTFARKGGNTLDITKSWHTCGEVSFCSESTSSGSLSSSNKLGVRFDPRVTVTEFEDLIKRCWYNDCELESLRHETIVLAQAYLLTHSEEAEEYNRAKLDPITRTYRKKALFSLPVLSHVSDEESLDALDNRKHEELLESQVKKILIVDPNRAILDLFCKTMCSMFPSAQLHTTSNADEALHLVASNLQQPHESLPFQHRNFDIVIVEQRLCSLQKSNKPISFASLETSLHSFEQRWTLRKPGSFSGVPIGRAFDMCGSDLLKKIVELEQQALDQHDKGLNSAPTVSQSCLIYEKSVQRQALLIGVSMHPDRDADDLRRAGADVVWGKPIPRVGDALRNQLLKALISKRRRRRRSEGDRPEFS